MQQNPRPIALNKFIYETYKRNNFLKQYDRDIDDLCIYYTSISRKRVYVLEIVKTSDNDCKYYINVNKNDCDPRAFNDFSKMLLPPLI